MRKIYINFVICDIPLRNHFVSDDNNPNRYAITRILTTKFKYGLKMKKNPLDWDRNNSNYSILQITITNKD